LSVVQTGNARRLLALSMMFAVLLAAGCGGGERLTVEEYAAFCSGGIASAARLIEPEDVTWGDLVEISEPSIERLRGVAPPRELADVHRASLKTLEFVVEVAKERPADEIANPLSFGLNGIRIATQLRRAVEDLPGEVRWTLREAGCL